MASMDLLKHRDELQKRCREAERKMAEGKAVFDRWNSENRRLCSDLFRAERLLKEGTMPLSECEELREKQRKAGREKQQAKRVYDYWRGEDQRVAVELLKVERLIKEAAP